MWNTGKLADLLSKTPSPATHHYIAKCNVLHCILHRIILCFIEQPFSPVLIHTPETKRRKASYLRKQRITRDQASRHQTSTLTLNTTPAQLAV